MEKDKTKNRIEIIRQENNITLLYRVEQYDEMQKTKTFIIYIYSCNDLLLFSVYCTIYILLMTKA